MGIIGDATKDNICVSWVAFVDFLIVFIKPVMNIQSIRLQNPANEWIYYRS